MSEVLYLLTFWYLLCFYKGRETFGRFQVEAPRAYTCKLILCLCHVYKCKEILGVDTWPMSLAPTIGESVWFAGNEKPWWGKNPCWASLAEKPFAKKGEIASCLWHVWHTQGMCSFKA
jgi:hypothetical protein